MYHSLIISGKNTYDEWGLVPTSRPLVVPPEVKTVYVNNPGGYGILDYTDNLTGNALYNNRKGSWEFWVRPEDEWANVYSSIMAYLHGIKHTVILEDDPDFFYTGRLSVNSWKSDKHNSIITINYNLEPYKQSIHENEDWKWDEHFERPIEIKTIKLFTNNVAVTSKKIVINNSGNMPIVPTFNLILSENVELKLITVGKQNWNGYNYIIDNEFSLVPGINKNENLVLNPGNSILFFWAELNPNSYGLENKLVKVIISYKSTSL